MIRQESNILQSERPASRSLWRAGALSFGLSLCLFAGTFAGAADFDGRAGIAVPPLAMSAFQLHAMAQPADEAFGPEDVKMLRELAGVLAEKAEAAVLAEMQGRHLCFSTYWRVEDFALHMDCALPNEIVDYPMSSVFRGSRFATVGYNGVGYLVYVPRLPAFVASKADAERAAVPPDLFWAAVGAARRLQEQRAISRLSP